MNTAGHFALCLSWLFALFGVLGGVLAAWSKSDRWFESVRRAIIGSAITACISVFALGFEFVQNNYTNQYVWQFSNESMEWWYKVSAIWGGMDGSMLLWAALLSLSAAVVARNAYHYPRGLVSWTFPVLSSSLLFFLTIVTFFTNPFRFLEAEFIPPDGNGLNPLLQNPLMAIHPPMLYLGFTTFAVPFAFCLGSLLAGDFSSKWVQLTRRWTLIAWGFLTAGIVLGGHWAYVELGWGGFWAWDPVENSSFLPWLTATALLHSIMVEEQKGMLRFWNIWLAIATYSLTVLGTFLTRSGVVQSVHAFASTDIGPVFLYYLFAVFVFSVALTFWRRKELRSERNIQSLFSREAALLINNLIFLSICFATLWGVLFPILSEAITGTKQAVGIPYFQAVNVPLFLLMLLMMGIGPMIAWKQSSIKQLFSLFFQPALLGCGAGIVLIWAGIENFYSVLSYALCFFVSMTLLQEFHRSAKRKKENIQISTGSIFSGTSGRVAQKRRIAGHIVHFGVVVAVIGITASMAHKIEREFALRKGENTEVGRFEISLEKIFPERKANFEALIAETVIRDRHSQKEISRLTPELRRYFRNGESTTEVALQMTLREDLYLVLAGLDQSGEKATLKVFINPLQIWLWIGSGIMLIGTLWLLVLKVPLKSQS